MDLQSISSYLLHPVIFYLAENLAMILILGFTSPNAIIRPAIFPLLLACVWKVVSVCPQTIYRVPWAGIVGGSIITSMFGYIESALINRWSFEAQGPTSSARPEGLVLNRNNHGGKAIAITSQTHGGTFWERFRFGFFVITSSRNIGTLYMIKNTPPFSTDNPERIPSRSSFLVRKAIIVVLAFLIIDLATLGAQPLEKNAVVFSAEAVPILTNSGENLGVEKILSRFVIVLGYWICTYLGIDGYISLVNFFYVALGLEDVRLYRPNFGSITEAYSIRQFWGVVWHQHLRKSLTAPADLVVYKILRLPKGGLITRYSHLSLIFLISGLLHTWVEVGQGFPARQSGQMQFFVTQVVGIVLEDAVQAVYRAMCGIQRGAPPRPMARAVGYLWLVMFLWWSTPVWFYPRQRVSRGDQRDAFLPFSLFASLKALNVA